MVWDNVLLSNNCYSHVLTGEREREREEKEAKTTSSTNTTESWNQKVVGILIGRKRKKNETELTCVETIRAQWSIDKSGTTKGKKSGNEKKGEREKRKKSFD